MFLAEVSDKIPTLAYYWAQAIGLVAFGYLLSRFSALLSLGLALVLLLLLIYEILGYDASDPFWQAVKSEKGMSYIIQSWVTLGLSCAVIAIVSIGKFMRNRKGEQVAGGDAAR